jgi:hypothetical protein
VGDSNGSQHIYGNPVPIVSSAPWNHDLPINDLKNSSSFRNVASPGTNVTCSGSPTSCSGSNVNLGTFPNGLGNYHSPGDLSISSNESDLDTLWNTSGQKAKQWENNRIRHRRFAEASDPEASAVAKIIGNEFQSVFVRVCYRLRIVNLILVDTLQCDSYNKSQCVNSEPFA